MALRSFRAALPAYAGAATGVRWVGVRGGEEKDLAIMGKIVYRPLLGDELWWCNSHQRRATYVLSGDFPDKVVCDPKLGGIMLPCQCVNLTGIAELEEKP